MLERNTDLVQFGLNLGVIGREGDETGESTGSILVTLFLDEPSRRLREEDHANSENETPNELDGNRESPRSAGGFVLGGIVDDGGDEETDCDRPLITGDESTAVLIVQ